MKQYYRIALACAIVSASLATARADRRSYVWTYEYTTMPAGVAEAEYYLTLKAPDLGVKEASRWQHQLEIEYGLTDNWDVSMYQMWAQSYGTNSASSFKYEGFKIRSRYKFFKAGEFFVDPLLYVEYIKNANLAEPDAIEGKVILAKNIGKLNLAYNQIAERELSGDAETEHKYAAGASYAVGAGLSLGVEGTGNYTDDKHAIGPTLAVETEKFWFSTGAAFGLNDATEDMQARLIAGFAF